MLDAARAFDGAQRWLHMPEDRRLLRGKAHVAGEQELAAGPSDTARDLGDGDQPALAQTPEQKAERRLPGQLGGGLPVLGDAVHVDVGDEVVRVGAAEH